MTPTTLPGTQIVPGHTVIDLLGHGHRVDTYEVFSDRRQCRCVVKILRPDRADDPRVRASVTREGILLRGLSHPHLLRGYDVFTKPRPGMVVENLPGGTLDTITKERPLGFPDAAHLGLQLGSAVHYLHLQGWLHLDITPANITINSGRAVLIDLSAAARAGPGRPGAGTDGYLAPEQVTGDHLSPATDVWSLAVTLIQALAGGRPVGATSQPIRFWNVAPLKRATRALDGTHALPRTVRHILLGCLDPNPPNRPELAELRDTLNQALSEADCPPHSSTIETTPVQPSPSSGSCVGVPSAGYNGPRWR